MTEWALPTVCPDCGGHGRVPCGCVPQPHQCESVDEMVGEVDCPHCRGEGDVECERCFARGAVTECRMGFRARVEARAPRFSWDEAQRRGVSFHGWHMDELIYRLLEQTANGFCDQCKCGGDCIHNGARTVLLMTRGGNAAAFSRGFGMQKKVTLLQPKDDNFDPPKDEYTVEKTVNCLEPRVGEILTWKQARALIDDGAEVTVKGQK